VANLLLVVENQGEVATTFYDQVADELSNTAKQIHLLWMSDLSPEDLVESLAGSGADVTLLQAAKPLQSTMLSQNAELDQWASELLDTFSDFPDVWRARLFEFHFNHWLWPYLVRFNVVADQLEEDHYDLCCVVGQPDFVALIQDFCDSRKIPFYGRVTGTNTGNLHIVASLFGYWLRNLFREIWGWWSTRKYTSPALSDIWVYAPYPRNWLQLGKNISQRFVGLLSSHNSQAERAYLISLTHISARGLKSCRDIVRDLHELSAETPDMPYALLENFGNLGAIIKNYFRWVEALRWFKLWYTLKQAGSLSWRGVNVSTVLFEPMLSAALVDWPKNRYLESCVSNALEALGGKSLLVPIFELVEGRSVVRAGKQAGAKVIGIQHGAIGLAHRWRVALPQGLMMRFGGQDYQPDCIAVEGQVACDWLLEAGLEPDRVDIVGAPRITAEMPPVDLDDMRKAILVLGEYHRPQVLFDWCAQHLLGLGYQIVVRPHPAHYRRSEKWLLEQDQMVRQQIHMNVPGESLADNLVRLKPVCVLSSVTGAMVEVALSGWPLGVVLSNWLPDYAPLTAMPDSDIFSSHDAVEVKTWIERLWGDVSYRDAYSQICIRAARLHIDAIGQEAAQSLAEVL
jgi:hypothetical protein